MIIEQYLECDQRNEGFTQTLLSSREQKEQREDSSIVCESKQDNQIKSETHLQRFEDRKDTFDQMMWKHNETDDY